MLMYKDNGLRECYNQMKRNMQLFLNQKEIKERDFVSAIRFYLNFDVKTVFILSGLRKTGKTLGVFQSVIDCNNVLYLCAEKNDDVTVQDYIRILENTKCDYIIIDDFISINGFKEISELLWTLVINGKKVIITGSDCFALQNLSKDTLRNKCCLYYANKFTYKEYCNIYAKESNKDTFVDYLKYGGSLKPSKLDSLDSAMIYLNVALIDDLARYTHIGREKIKFIVYNIIYLAVTNSTMNMAEYAKKEFNIENGYCNEFVSKDKVRFSYLEFRRIIGLLTKIGFVSIVNNIEDVQRTINAKEWRYRLYLTNPSITYHFAKVLLYDKTEEECLNRVIESVMVNYVKGYLSNNDYMWYTDNKESDDKSDFEIIIVSPGDSLVYFVSTRFEDSTDLKSDNGITSKYLEDLFPASTVGGRYIVCNIDKERCNEIDGKKVIFTRTDYNTLMLYKDFNVMYESLK